MLTILITLLCDNELHGTFVTVGVMAVTASFER